MTARTRRYRAWLGAVALAGAVGLGACGSAPVSLIQLRHRAGTICATADRRLGAISAPRSTGDALPFLAAGAAALSLEVRRLNALSAPKDDRDVYTSAIQAIEGEVAALHGAVAALHHGGATITSFRTLQSRLGPLERQADAAWRALQVPACVSR